MTLFLPLQVEEGLTLLLEVLQNPALQKSTKVWYLLQAHVLQLVAVYLSLPAARLSLKLRQQIFVQGELQGKFKTLPVSTRLTAVTDEAPCKHFTSGFLQSSPFEARRGNLRELLCAGSGEGLG